jgi:hypothetical protein
LFKLARLDQKKGKSDYQNCHDIIGTRFLNRR